MGTTAAIGRLYRTMIRGSPSFTTVASASAKHFRTLDALIVFIDGDPETGTVTAHPKHRQGNMP